MIGFKLKQDAALCVRACVCVHVMTRSEWVHWKEPDVAHLFQPIIPLHPSLSLHSLRSVLAGDQTASFADNVPGAAQGSVPPCSYWRQPLSVMPEQS